MRQLIGYVLLLAAVGLVPADVVAQRRPAARPAASRAQRPQFAAELNWSSDVDLGIGGRGVFPLQSLFPKTPLDGIVSFDYFFPSAPSGVSLPVPRSGTQLPCTLRGRRLEHRARIRRPVGRHQRFPNQGGTEPARRDHIQAQGFAPHAVRGGSRGNRWW